METGPLKLADNPGFLTGLQDWKKDLKKKPDKRSVLAPDPRALNRQDEELMRLLDAMLGPGGYMKYVSALRGQRGSGAPLPPQAPPVPSPTPTPRTDPQLVEAGWLAGGGR